jgi:dTDP-4-dehydrorhamnose 3,5-epimerase
VKFVPAEIPGVIIVEPDVHTDVRGFFLETYHAEKYRTGGIVDVFVQDNHSRSAGGTIRGLHLQFRRPQGKLIHVIEGSIFDVAVDVRRGSPTFGKWVGVTLSADNFKQCYIPKGFAHGFAVTSPIAQVEYKCTDVYDASSEIGIAWDDPDLGITWPIADPVLSERDKRHPRLADVAELPAFR